MVCIAGTWSATLSGGPKRPWLLTVHGKVLAEVGTDVSLEPVVEFREHETALLLEVVQTQESRPPKGSGITPPIGAFERDVKYERGFSPLTGCPFNDVVIVNCNYLKIPIENAGPPKKP
jgi:hypothetical protein